VQFVDLSRGFVDCSVRLRFVMQSSRAIVLGVSLLLLTASLHGQQAASAGVAAFFACDYETAARRS
jgi:hypothetical protein